MTLNGGRWATGGTGTASPLSAAVPCPPASHSFADGSSAGAPKRSAKYHLIRDRLAAQIVSGDLTAGSRLPSEHELSETFGVSRVTVRHALSALRKDGLIESAQGRGHFVAPFKIDIRGDRLEGLGALLAPRGVPLTSTVLSHTERRMPPKIADALGLRHGERAVRLVRLRSAMKIVVCVEERWLPEGIATRLPDDKLREGDMVSALETGLDVKIAYADETIEILPTPLDVAEHLGLEPETPVFHMTQVVYALGGRAVCYGKRHGRTDVFRFKARTGRW